MIADVVNVVTLWFAVFAGAFDPVADAGLALGIGSERARLRQQRLQELDRDDRRAFVHHGVDARHADIHEHLHVLDVGIAKGHPEARAAHRDVLRERFELLVVEAVDVLRADAVREGEAALDLERLRLHPRAVFPVAAVRGDLAEVDLRIEVRGEGLAVIACVAIDDVERVDLAEVMLQGVGGVHIRHARVKAAAEQRGEARRFEFLLISPLPVVFELRHVTRLVVRGVDVVHAGLQAGVHDGEVLIRQRHIDHDLRFEVVQESHQLRHIVRIDARGLDRALQFGGDAVALRLRAAGEHDLTEDVGKLGAFVGDDAADAAGSDDEDSMRHDEMTKSE